MDSETFRRLGHALIDWIADYREGLRGLPVMSPAQPGEIAAAFPKHPPAQGGHAEEALHTLDQTILRGITHWNHPRFFAYFPSNTSYASVLGDLMTAGLGAQGMSWQTSPAATELEEVVMDWLRQMVGLSPAWTGVIHDTASTATLTALLCARERSTGFSQDGGGLQGEAAPLMVYCSEQAHSSIEKGVRLGGFGKANLRLIPTDQTHALQADVLEAAIAEDRAAGRIPCAVVACIGTTATTAVDPLAAIAAISERHGLWLHVDAAMAGTAMVLPECRGLWAGIERADSLVFNPHKWMGVGFDLSAYYVRDPAHLVRVMSSNPSYLQTKQDGEATNFRDWHLQLGRRFRALKLWMFLQDVGVEGLQARLRRDLANAQRLAAMARSTPGWELLAPVVLQTVCLRHVPAGISGDELALKAHNLEIARQINEGGQAYLTPSLLKGRQMLRVSIGAEGTELADVQALWGLLQAAGAAARTRGVS